MKASKSKLLAIALVLVTFLSLVPLATLQDSFVNVEEYGLLRGVLDSDTYALYPYESKSLDIGFSKYGSMVSRDACPTCGSVGLNYDDAVDPFCNENVSINEWNEGWLMNITYDYEGDLHEVWAFALFSDFRGIEGDWILNCTGPLDDRPGYRGGRKTNGYAETDDMQVLYDGPRKCIVLCTTRIYDPLIPNPNDPDDPKGLPLVVLYIQIVFNKVKKYALLIKDIKLTTESKLLEKVQVKFGQRGEWDLGWEPEPWMPRSYAHFYHGLPTKYYKHPWYYVDEMYTGYDLCQIIDQDENYVAWAAFWPELMSYRVESIAQLTRTDKLTDLSDWEHTWTGDEGSELDGSGDYEYVTSIPGYYQDWLWYPDCEFPPYWGEPDPYDGWDGARPDVYVDDVLQTEGIDYVWDYSFGEPGGENRPEPGVNDVAIAGDFWLILFGYPGDDADIYVHWKCHAEQDDMTTEPRTPYTMGEWVFDLSYDDEDLPTHQFRCITVYGVTDLNDGEDWDMGGEAENIIDSEVMYQLNEVFNPWDLRQAVGQESWGDYECMWDCDWGYECVRDWWPGKNTERWVEFYTGDGDEDTFWLPQQIVVPGPDDDIIDNFPAWDAYCSPREKILVDGVLQVPGDDYEIYWNWHVEEVVEEGIAEIDEGDSFDLMYPRIIPGTEYVWIEDDEGWAYDYYPDEYTVDHSNGKIHFWWEHDLSSDEEIHVSYDLYFPASSIEFYEESIPEEDAEIKVLYSTFRIVWKTDKFLPGIDGLRIQNSDEYTYMSPDEMQLFFLRFGPVIPPEFLWWVVHAPTYLNELMVYRNGYPVDPMYWEFQFFDDMPCIWVDYQSLELMPYDVIEVVYPILAGRYEWTTVGTDSAAVDSASASMVTEGFRQWKNFDTKIASLDYQDPVYAPEEPFMFRNVSGPSDERDNYYDDHMAQTVEDEAGRLHLRDDWCTTLPISSSNIIVIGGPYPNLAAEYFNDFTDIHVPRIGETWGTGFYGPGCWGRNLWEAEYDEGEQVTGYALISTYKDLNGTIGFIVYGWTGQDTYYACYALQHGLLEIMQLLQPGVTSILVEFDYTVHPAEDCFFHIVECIGTFTECGGFDHLMFKKMGMYDDDLLFKFIMNSYSSEYWVFHAHVDFDVEHFWSLPDLYAIAVTYPQYIYFHWEAKIHPDP